MIETIILAVQGVVVAGIGLLAKWVVATKAQVKNDHKTNLRDDIDEFREAMHQSHIAIRSDIGDVSERVARLEGKVYTTNSLIISDRKGRK